MAADPASLPNLSANVPALPASLRPLLLLVGIAAAVAAGVWIVLWSRGPTYSLLYANLSPQDEAQIAQALDAAQIPYRLDGGASGIEVPAERLDEARLKLAGQGLADNDSFAALEKSSGFGVSQFMEDVRYQHALELELARTIASLQPIAGARVNLAEPRQSVFVSDDRTASASVFVELKPGASLGAEQVQAIVNLVASSVPNLSPAEVTVVDQQGRLLSAPNGHDPYAIDEREYDMVHRMETDYARRIEALLTPIVGPGLVHAQVVAELNMGTSEQAKELYTPNSQIVRSEHLSEQSAGGAGSGGVPGSLSNEPPAPGVIVPPSAPNAGATAGQSGAAASGSQNAAAANGAQAAGTATPAGASPQAATKPVGGTVGAPGGDTTSSDITRNYEIDRTLDYSNQPAGTVRRLTVAVLIGDRTVTGPDGKQKKVPLSAQDLARVTQLVKDAVGFDASRGDSVSVVNESLDTAGTPAAADGGFQAPPLWQSPFVWSLLRIVAGLVGVLVLVLSVLRPLVRTLITPMRLAGPAASGAQGLAAASGGPAGAAAALPSGKDVAAAALTHEQQLAQARTMVNQDPKRVAQVVRGWVGKDE
ncbi:MAG TPA: flagellar basal-body MS-ring/collar protein FliF [Steroidobacteraceae bacterium]|nr:flagellar basal-body MS-ring/collar protein FliF [Steroidobacteraceae bacterium]